MREKVDIVVIGTIIKETIQFPDSVLGPVLGSPAAYSSLVMSAQGLNVGIVTYCGNDMGELINELDTLDKRGILQNDFTTTNRLVYREDGTKYVEYFKKAPNIKFENIHLEYLKSDYFKICPMDYEVDVEIIKKLNKLGKTTFIDLGGYGGATSDTRYSIYTDYGRNIIEDICNYGKIIKASQEDLLSIIPNKSVEEATDVLMGMGAKNVVITLGSKGAMFKKEDSPVTYVEPMEAFSEEPNGELDFTGAGDSFGAGFMVSYVKYQDIKKAVENGNATASLVIQKSGGCTFDRMPNSEKVARRVAIKKTKQKSI